MNEQQVARELVKIAAAIVVNGEIKKRDGLRKVAQQQLIRYSNPMAPMDWDRNTLRGRVLHGMRDLSREPFTAAVNLGRGLVGNNPLSSNQVQNRMSGSSMAYPSFANALGLGYSPGGVLLNGINRMLYDQKSFTNTSGTPLTSFGNRAGTRLEDMARAPGYQKKAQLNPGQPQLQPQMHRTLMEAYRQRQAAPRNSMANPIGTQGQRMGENLGLYNYLAGGGRNSNEQKPPLERPTGSLLGPIRGAGQRSGQFIPVYRNLLNMAREYDPKRYSRYME